MVEMSYKQLWGMDSTGINNQCLIFQQDALRPLYRINSRSIIKKNAKKKAFGLVFGPKGLSD